MRHKILIIDDRYEERAEVYFRLTSKYVNDNVARPSTFEVELEFVSNPHEVESLLRRNDYSAVILDVVLNKWHWSPSQPVRASEMLAQLDDDIPVALLSEEWVAAEVKALVSDWPTKNCRMFIHWEDLSDESLINEKGSLTRIVYELSRHIAEYKELAYSIALNEDDPINILHLSDLQFGGFENWNLKLDYRHCANTIRKRWPEGPTFITITGDIAQSGLPEEYAAATQWISFLVAEFGWTLPSQRILLVPGNHDVCLPFSTASLLTLEETKESANARKKEPSLKKNFRVDFKSDRSFVSDLTNYAYMPYLEFCSKVVSRKMLPFPSDDDRKKDMSLSFAWLEARFRHLGVVFFGLNTAQPAIPGQLPLRNVSSVATDEITREAKQINCKNDKSLFFIGMSHHSPFKGPEGSAVDNPESFEQLFSDLEGLELWMHGHWHERSTQPISPRPGVNFIVNSAQTLTIPDEHRPDDTLRGFSLVELSRKTNEVYKCQIVPVEWGSNKSLIIRDREGRLFERDDLGVFRSVEGAT